MAVPVLTAVTDARWESDLVAALVRGDLGITVVRRCVDLADLLATAATGSARAALLSADLRRLDRDALSRLAATGIAVVGVVPPGDQAAEARLRQLGVHRVLPADTPPTGISTAVLAAVGGDGPAGRASGAGRGTADPRLALPDLPGRDLPAGHLPGDDALTGHLPGDDAPTGHLPGRDPSGTALPGGDLPGTDRPGDPPGSGDGPVTAAGRLVAVWGPTGAPGRSTVAIGLAAEVAQLGRPALLVDADVYGGVVAQVLGLLDEAPGLAAACRLANTGRLDAAALADLARGISPTLRVLSGIARADRWPELRPAALETTLELARGLAEVTVVDCGFALEQDEELAYDTLVPRRNGATLTVLEQADTVIAVGSADPVGLQRLVRALSELREAVPGVVPLVVVNRLRGSAVPGDAAAEVRAALARYAGVPQVHFVPYDRVGLDRAMSAGRTLAEAAPQTPARLALRELAAGLLGVRPGSRRLSRRRTGPAR